MISYSRDFSDLFHTTTNWQDFLLLYMLLLLSHFSCVWLCETPQTAAHQVPPSLGFSRQEHWSGLPFPSPVHGSEKWKWSRSVVSDSSRPHGLQPTRLLHPWDLPGKSTGVGCHRYGWIIFHSMCVYVNSTAVSMKMQISLQDPLDIYPEFNLLDHMIVLFLLW